MAGELDREQRYPWENVRQLVEHDLAGLFIPKEFGGQGASLSATVAVVETIGSGCASTAAILCTYQLGAFPILLAGRDDQKQRYLGEMAKGVATSFALSERSAGSDAAAIEATANREGDGWRCAARNTGSATAERPATTWSSPRPIRRGRRGISAFMVDKEQPGAVVDELADKIGIRGTQTSNLRLDLVVPDTHGWARSIARCASFQTLDVGRVMVAAQSLGLELAAYREASRRAVERRAFGQPIIENQGSAPARRHGGRSRPPA